MCKKSPKKKMNTTSTNRRRIQGVPEMAPTEHQRINDFDFNNFLKAEGLYLQKRLAHLEAEERKRELATPGNWSFLKVWSPGSIENFQQFAKLRNPSAFISNSNYFAVGLVEIIEKSSSGGIRLDAEDPSLVCLRVTRKTELDRVTKDDQNDSIGFFGTQNPFNDGEESNWKYQLQVIGGLSDVCDKLVERGDILLIWGAKKINHQYQPPVTAAQQATQIIRIYSSELPENENVTVVLFRPMDSSNPAEKIFSENELFLAPNAHRPITVNIEWLDNMPLCNILKVNPVFKNKSKEPPLLRLPGGFIPESQNSQSSQGPVLLLRNTQSPQVRLHRLQLSALNDNDQIVLGTSESVSQRSIRENSIGIATPEHSIATPTKSIAIATPTKAIAIATPTKAIAIATPTKAIAIATPTKAIAIATPGLSAVSSKSFSSDASSSDSSYIPETPSPSSSISSKSSSNASRKRDSDFSTPNCSFPEESEDSDDRNIAAKLEVERDSGQPEQVVGEVTASVNEEDEEFLDALDEDARSGIIADPEKLADGQESQRDSVEKQKDQEEEDRRRQLQREQLTSQISVLIDNQSQQLENMSDLDFSHQADRLLGAEDVNLNHLLAAPSSKPAQQNKFPNAIEQIILENTVNDLLSRSLQNEISEQHPKISNNMDIQPAELLNQHGIELIPLPDQPSPAPSTSNFDCFASQTLEDDRILQNNIRSSTMSENVSSVSSQISVSGLPILSNSLKRLISSSSSAQNKSDKNLSNNKNDQRGVFSTLTSEECEIQNVEHEDKDKDEQSSVFAHIPKNPPQSSPTLSQLISQELGYSPPKTIYVKAEPDSPPAVKMLKFCEISQENVFNLQCTVIEMYKTQKARIREDDVGYLVVDDGTLPNFITTEPSNPESQLTDFLQITQSSSIKVTNYSLIVPYVIIGEQMMLYSVKRKRNKKGIYKFIMNGEKTAQMCQAKKLVAAPSSKNDAATQPIPRAKNCLPSSPAVLSSSPNSSSSSSSTDLIGGAEPLSGAARTRLFFQHTKKQAPTTPQSNNRGESSTSSVSSCIPSRYVKPTDSSLDKNSTPTRVTTMTPRNLRNRKREASGPVEGVNSKSKSTSEASTSPKKPRYVTPRRTRLEETQWEEQKKKYNLRECSVVLERLQLLEAKVKLEPLDVKQEPEEAMEFVEEKPLVFVNI